MTDANGDKGESPPCKKRLVNLMYFFLTNLPTVLISSQIWAEDFLIDFENTVIVVSVTVFLRQGHTHMARALTLVKSNSYVGNYEASGNNLQVCTLAG